MLGEIKKSVDTASRNPNRFKLTNVEIQGRRGWMDSVGRRVETLRSQVWGLIRVNTGATEFTSTSAKPLTTTTTTMTTTQGANMTANMTTNMTTPKPTTTKTKTNANMDSFIASETAQQQQMIVRQDQELDVLGASSLLPLPRLSLSPSPSLFLSLSLSLSSKLPLTPGAARFVRIRQAPTCYGSENSARRWARSSTRRASSWTSLATKWWGHRPGACSGTRPLTADVDWLAATG